MRPSPMGRMLVRDLWQMRGQALAIAGVVAAGVAVYVLMLATFHSLDLTLRTYYARYRMGDVFATAQRAPDWLAPRLAAIPGVARLDTRVEAEVVLRVPGATSPVGAHLISWPGNGHPVLDDVCLRAGRFPDPAHPDEVMVGESFAAARGLRPGDSLEAVLDGHARALRIVGTGLTPEYVYTVRPGAFLPDDAHYGLVWMARDAMARAFDMGGAFNRVAVRLEPDVRPEPVMARLDELLAPYGGAGAVPRARQASNWMVMAKVTNLETMGTALPVIFLAVAAFLIDLVLTRLVGMQREQIAVLKALGYGDARVAWHYAQWGLVITGIGALAGIGGGVVLGRALTRLYSQYFQFPLLQFELPPATAVTALAVGVLAAAFGTWKALRAVLALPPAEAMRPEPPATYRASVFERGLVKRLFGQPTRIILRNMQRQPGRALLSLVGIAFGTAIVVVGTFSSDAVDRVMAIQFDHVQRFDATVSFLKLAPARTPDALRRLPGVTAVEGFRTVGARLHVGPRFRLVAIASLPAAPRLDRVVDQRSLEPLHLDDPGLALDARLAASLGVRRGDIVDVEILEGSRPRRPIVVSRIFADYVGTSAYLEEGALHALLHEDRCYTGAYLRLDAAQEPAFLTSCAAVPAISAVQLRRTYRDSFDQAMAQGFRIQRTFAAFFAAVIAFGVVYNSARVILSERSRELATLRIIGFGPRDVAYILVGELAFLTACAIPLGLALGTGLAFAIAGAVDNDLIRLPAAVSHQTLLTAALVIGVAAVVSAWIVARGLARLDLVAVLKTKE